jgi:hypothetical protein
LFIDPFDDFIAVTSCDRVAHIDHQHFLGERITVGFADLLYRRIGNDDHHDVAKFDSFRNPFRREPADRARPRAPSNHRDGGTRTSRGARP